ncbi:MAG: RES domain-containing protein [Hydrogenophaga sp.]
MSLISVWRIGYCQMPLPDSADILMSQGLGSTFFDGRWHTKTGRQIVYTGSSRALCQLEKRVHTGGLAVKDQILMRFDLPPDALLIDAIDLGLDVHWANDLALTRSLGDKWLQQASSLGMWVPSFVEPLEKNLLLNPVHPHYPSIQLTVERNPFEFDPRLT